LALGFKGEIGGGHRFLYETIPHKIPYDRLTPIEVTLWVKHIDHIKASTKAKK
jgi:hypothetical protein